MAMTKKEKAEIDRLLGEVRVLGALRWTDGADTDVPVPSASVLVNGWLYNAWNGSVDKACSSSVSHSFGNWDKTTSQGPRRLYSTRLRALLACRHAVELECAKKLAAIDEKIEQERISQSLDGQIGTR